MKLLSVLFIVSILFSYSLNAITFEKTERYIVEIRAFDEQNNKEEVGYIRYAMNAMGERVYNCEIERLNIIQNYQKKGIGSSLFKQAVQDMHERGAAEVSWYSTMTAIPFYQKQGAQLVPGTTNSMKLVF
jgi:GNAT superfamily N-acetyltransferase